MTIQIALTGSARQREITANAAVPATTTALQTPMETNLRPVRFSMDDQGLPGTAADGMKIFMVVAKVALSVKFPGGSRKRLITL